MWIPIDALTKKERQVYLPDSIENSDPMDHPSLETQDVVEEPPLDLEDDAIPIEFSEDLLFSDNSGIAIAAHSTYETEPHMKMPRIEEYPLR